MSLRVRNYPITASIGLTAIAMALTVAMVQHQRQAAGAEGRAKPLTALSTAPYDESDVRDRDIELYSRRIT